MKQIFVGSYYLGRESIDVYLREGKGAEFWIMPEKGRTARMKIGTNYKNWSDVLVLLLHESFEFMLERLSCRFECTNDLSNDHSAYLFVFTHNQLSDICVKVGDFLSECVPDINKTWKKWKGDK